MLEIVLIDDEEVVLRGIRHLLEPKSSEYDILGSFQNPLEALEFIRGHAEETDVVMTDVKMPYMNGIELVRQVNEIRPEITTVVMSAYTDYEYIRQSMKNGAVDYLLKPCRWSDIYALLQKAEKAKEGSRLQDQLKKTGHFLQKVLRGTAPEGRLETGLWAEGTPVRCVVLVGEDLAVDEWKKKIDLKDVVYLVYENDIWLFSARPGFADDGDRRVPYQTAQDFIWTREELEQALERIRSKKAYRVFNDKTKSITEDRWKELLEKEEICLEEYLPFDRVEQAVLRGREDQLQLILKTAFGRLKKESGGWVPEQFKTALIRFCYQMDERIRTGGYNPGPDRFSEQEKMLTDIRKSSTIEQALEGMEAYLMEMLSFFAEDRKTPLYIRQAVAYIEANYMQDLSLGMVSDYVSLNQWYFSSQFKKYMGVSMGEYLNSVRIQASVKLMRESDLKLGEIAEMVGFRDSAYFGRVFKKAKNVSPKEYRMAMLSV